MFEEPTEEEKYNELNSGKIFLDSEESLNADWLSKLGYKGTNVFKAGTYNVTKYQNYFLVDENGSNTFATKIFQNNLINSNLKSSIVAGFNNTKKYDSIQWGSYYLNDGPITYVSSCIANHHPLVYMA